MKILELIKNKKIKPESEDTPVLKPQRWRSYYIYKFTFRGLHFQIEAKDNFQAWDMAKTLTNNAKGLFLLETSNLYGELACRWE